VVLPSESESNEPTPTPKPEESNHTPTPEPSPPNVTKCETAKECEEKQEEAHGDDLCVDIQSKKCQDKTEQGADDQEDPIGIEIEIGDKTEDKDQDFVIVGDKGAYLGAIKVGKGSLPKGALLKVKYLPGKQNDDLEKDKDDGCSSGNDALSSYGSLQVNAKTKDGKTIKNLGGNGLTLELPIKGATIEELKKTGACFGFTDETRADWECDPEKTKFEDLGNGIVLATLTSDHLTSFAVLLGSGTSSCDKTLLIVSVSLIVGIPLTMILLAFLATRFYFGRAFLYGYKGAEMRSVVKSIRQGTDKYCNVSATSHA
jgi:hypothetical protein